MMSLNNPGLAKTPEEALAALFEENGWVVEREPQFANPFQPDLVIQKGPFKYVVEIKSASEGRSDRVIPLLSQAILQAQTYARVNNEFRPLAVVMVGDVYPSLVGRVRKFSEHYAPGIALGIASKDHGPNLFIGDGLEDLVDDISYYSRTKSSYASTPNLFSDLNQWMLKVLLAREIPDAMLAAPRNKYRSASELASAAQVSVMSAFRLVQLLKDESFLDESSPYFRLVRRHELFRRWCTAANRSRREVQMRFVIPGELQARLKGLLAQHDACLGLFAAAEAYKLGYVNGVPPYVYVRRLPGIKENIWPELIPPSPGESAHLVLKLPSAPQSVFRGAVFVDGMRVTDIIQVWLDVSENPFRGQEQADLIQNKVLAKVFKGHD